MKLFSGLLCATVLSALSFAGCQTAGHYTAEPLRPAVMLDGPSQASIGEVKQFTAHTMDAAGAKGIQWMVEPSTARITPENNNSGQTAMFTASQRGTYIVTARIDPGNGQLPVESKTTIDVVGAPTASERMSEPARRP